MDSTQATYCDEGHRLWRGPLFECRVCALTQMSSQSVRDYASSGRDREIEAHATRSPTQVLVANGWTSQVMFANGVSARVGVRHLVTAADQADLERDLAKVRENAKVNLVVAPTSVLVDPELALTMVRLTLAAAWRESNNVSGSDTLFGDDNAAHHRIGHTNIPIVHGVHAIDPETGESNRGYLKPVRERRVVQIYVDDNQLAELAITNDLTVLMEDTPLLLEAGQIVRCTGYEPIVVSRRGHFHFRIDASFFRLWGWAFPHDHADALPFAQMGHRT